MSKEFYSWNIFRFTQSNGVGNRFNLQLGTTPHIIAYEYDHECQYDHEYEYVCVWVCVSFERDKN